MCRNGQLSPLLFGLVEKRIINAIRNRPNCVPPLHAHLLLNIYVCLCETNM